VTPNQRNWGSDAAFMTLTARSLWLEPPLCPCISTGMSLQVSRAETVNGRVTERCGKADPCHNTTGVADQSNSGRDFAGVYYGRYWARTSDPQLVELVLSQLS